jgi:hypothetical protein
VLLVDGEFDRTKAGDSSANHFGDDKNQNRPAKTAPEQQVDERVSSGGEHGGCDQGDHMLEVCCLIFLSEGEQPGCL